MSPIIAHLLAASGRVPNHPRWPLLVYPGAVAICGADPAAAFERLFARNRWPAAWRNGVHAFHHYHSDGHEALGVYSGEVTVLFGGEGGVTLTARPGDVIVLYTDGITEMQNAAGDMAAAEAAAEKFVADKVDMVHVVGLEAAQAAAKALIENSDLDARRIVEKAMQIAASICIYTNDTITIEEL